VKANPDAIPESDIVTTSRWRGYLGEWEILGERLFLRDLLVATPEDVDSHLEFRDVSIMAQVFPLGEPVHAVWYSGYLIIPRGDPIRYAHMGFASTYSRYVVVEVESGFVVSQVKMKRRRFERFRRKQFRGFQNTIVYREAVDRLIEGGDTEQEAADFLFEAASVDYLSARFSSNPP